MLSSQISQAIWGGVCQNLPVRRFFFPSPSSHVLFRLLGEGGESYCGQDHMPHAKNPLISVSVSSPSAACLTSESSTRNRALRKHCEVTSLYSRSSSKPILSTHLPTASQVQLAVSSLSLFLLSSKPLPSLSPQYEAILYAPPRIPHRTSPPFSHVLTFRSRSRRRSPARAA